MKIKLFTIPNFLTLGNLLCGIISVLFLTGTFGNFSEDPVFITKQVLILMSLSLILDFLDGMVARLLKISSEIGVQLDSLADVISFGLVPGLMMMNLLNHSSAFGDRLYVYAGLLITLFSALRLAKFNVDTEQSTYFKGLATPANTIFIAGLLWIKAQNGFVFSNDRITEYYLLLLITVLFSWLLIADIPMFSFKLKGFGWKENYYKYIFLIICVILIALFQIKSLAFIIPIYIIISFIHRKKIINA